MNSFSYDKEFILKYDPEALILTEGDAQIIVSVKYQGKVFTSTFERESGKSLGWVNYKAFEGPLNNHMNAYGGENRFWLGPEGGAMSLYFEEGKEQVFENWHTPAAFDSEEWTLTQSNNGVAALSKQMQLTNYAGSQFNLRVDRSVQLLNKAGIEGALGLNLNNIKSVAYLTENKVINTGSTAWNEENGTFCTWMLDMFPVSDQTVMIIPFEAGERKPATTDYFGEIAEERLKFSDNALFFKADGKSRGKLGIHPKRVREFAGSYDTENQLLTIVNFDIDNNGQYLNQEWRLDKPLMSGDAMNAYNDGPLDDGSQMGPFYELESVSPAFNCAPGESVTHNHSVFHFGGSENELNKITEKLFRVSVNEIKQAF